MDPSDSSCLPDQLRSCELPSLARGLATVGDRRSPRFRCVPFRRDMVSDPGRVTAPRIAVPSMLPSTFPTGSASAIGGISWLNLTPHRIAVYASPGSSPSPMQHSLPGDALSSYPGRTCTGWNAPASPGALERLFAWLSRYRRLNIVFDREPDLFAAHIWIAMISIISRRVIA
jgi:hypothetical protein